MPPTVRLTARPALVGYYAKHACRHRCIVTAELPNSSRTGVTREASFRNLDEALNYYGVSRFALQHASAGRQACDSQALSSLTCLHQVLSEEDAYDTDDLHAKILGILHSCPGILTCDLPAWVAFFSIYGAPPGFLATLLHRSPHFFLSATLYDAGCVLLCLRQQLDMHKDDILQLVVLEAPGVLQLDVQRQLLPRLEALGASGLDREQVTDAVLRDPKGTLCAYWSDEEEED